MSEGSRRRALSLPKFCAADKREVQASSAGRDGSTDLKNEDRSCAPLRSCRAPRSPAGGVAVGAIAAIDAVWWIPYGPMWSFNYVDLGIAIIYALVDYGSRPAIAAEPEEALRNQGDGHGL